MDTITNCVLVDGICIKCQSAFSYSKVKKFMRNRVNKVHKKHLWDTCQKCWLRINTGEDTGWVEKNRQAQLIAQNKPEQKLKNAVAVSKSWGTDRKIKASNYLKNRWLNDEGFAKKALMNLSWTDKKDVIKYSERMKWSLGTGGLKGEYNNIGYDSALELSYILYCNDNNIEIKRYDLEPIKYIDEHGKTRLYFPDFIIEDKTIVEIKGFGIYYKLNLQRNILKLAALKEWCNSHQCDYYLLMNTDNILKINYKRARKLHHETKVKKDHQI